MKSLKKQTQSIWNAIKKNAGKIVKRAKEPFAVTVGKLLKNLWTKIFHPKQGTIPTWPKKPNDIHVHYVLYARGLTANIDCSEEYKTLTKLYKKHADLFFFLDRHKQKRNGTDLSLLLIKKIQPKNTNFINMAYIKGKSKVIPVDSAALDIINFMGCLKQNGAEFDQIYFEGDDEYVEDLKEEMGKILENM